MANKLSAVSFMVHYETDGTWVEVIFVGEFFIFYEHVDLIQ